VYRSRCRALRGQSVANPYVDVLAGPSLLDYGKDSHVTYYLDNTVARAWTTVEAVNFALAAQSWAAVANVTFTRVATAEQADIVETLRTTSYMDAVYGSGTVGVHALPYFGTAPQQGNFNADGATNFYGIGGSTSNPGKYAFQTLVHELGHALGLNHPHADILGDPHFPGVFDAFQSGDNGLNANLYTVMSYNDYRPIPTTAAEQITQILSGNVIGPMAFDIAAIQQMYGANATYHTGNDVYHLESMMGTTTLWQCIWDAGGTDTIDYLGVSAVSIDLRAATLLNEPGGGGFLSVRIGNNAGGYTIANGVVIENATGGIGNDILTGNAASNVLSGNSGADVLDGGAGVDFLYGGAGNDTYIVHDVLEDLVFESNVLGERGIDTVISESAWYLLGANVENLVLSGPLAITGFGNNLDNRIQGNELDNRLEGGGGNDILDGGDGTDTLVGGQGNDTYILSFPVTDVVTELAGEGDDTVQAAFAIDLTNYQNVENATLLGTFGISVTGNEFNNILTGNSGANTMDGGDGNDTLIGADGIDALIGGNGDDTFVLGAGADTITDDSGDDTIRSTISRSLADFTGVENIILDGAANANATGDGNANTLTGNSGNNVLNGGAGADTLAGGGGNDTYYIDDVGDTVAETLSGTLGGTDTVVVSTSALSYDLAINFENLVLLGLSTITGRGNGLANSLTGNSLDNTLEGGGGNDVLAGGAGVDTLVGGLGDDTYVLADAQDVITELAGQGNDTIRASFSYVLSDAISIENITLAGTIALNATGNSAVNKLIGNSGANSLDGKAGADRMEGGAGNDKYYVDNIGDVVVESLTAATGGGIDAVYVSVLGGYTLGANQDILVFTEAAYTSDGNGNALSNRIYGNSFDNFINGMAGADLMYGGGGADYYLVDNAGDRAIETLGGTAGGLDQVQSSVSFVLGANIENLALTGGNINGTGNTLNNHMIGSSGNNVINGGIGRDYMDGGYGNDTYYVDNAGDKAVEFPGGSSGLDTVISSVSFNLSNVNQAQGDIERLFLSGTAAINGYGNALNNALTGNIAANILYGFAGNDALNGGLGNDTLTGGAGNDTFVFNTGLSATLNRDTIKDFVAINDTIQLENAIFITLGTATGVLADAKFWIGTAAHDADDRIIYNQATGALYYDSNGNAAGGSVQFAVLTTHSALTNADFIVI
jgi:trimeric autotransporter adhesin